MTLIIYEKMKMGLKTGIPPTTWCDSCLITMD